MSLLSAPTAPTLGAPMSAGVISFTLGQQVRLTNFDSLVFGMVIGYRCGASASTIYQVRYRGLSDVSFEGWFDAAAMVAA